jgi:hypothetical protein
MAVTAATARTADLATLADLQPSHFRRTSSRPNVPVKPIKAHKVHPAPKDPLATPVLLAPQVMPAVVAPVVNVDHLDLMVSPADKAHLAHEVPQEAPGMRWVAQEVKANLVHQDLPDNLDSPVDLVRMATPVDLEPEVIPVNAVVMDNLDVLVSAAATAVTVPSDRATIAPRPVWRPDIRKLGPARFHDLSHIQSSQLHNINPLYQCKELENIFTKRKIILSIILLCILSTSFFTN